MNKVQFYDRVRLKAMDASDLFDDPEMDIQIVPPHEADAVAGRISAEAPVGRAALHRKPGDHIAIAMLGKQVKMQILSVVKHAAVV